MNRPTENIFDATAMCYLDGQATEAQTRRLFGWMADDPEFQKRYVRLAYQHGLMCELMQPRELAPPHETPEDHAAATLSRTRRLPPRTPWYRQPARLAAVLMGAVLIGALAMLTQWSNRIHDPAALPVVATVIETDEARWAGDVRPTIGDDLHPDQRLALAAGRVTIRYVSGVQMRIEGPAYLRLRHPMRADLERGWILAEVPAEARGFELHAPGMRARDLGTVFGMGVEEEGRTELHVIRGLVEAQPLAADNTAMGKTLELKTNQAAAVDRSQRLETFAADPNRFQKLKARAVHGVRSVRGKVRLLKTLPGSLNALQSDRLIHVFLEQRNVALPANLPILQRSDAPGLLSRFQPQFHRPANLAGKRADVYAIVYNPNRSRSRGARLPSAHGAVLFDKPVLGIIAGDKTLAATASLARPGLVYNSPSQGAGLEGREERNPDRLTLSSDRRRLDVVMTVLRSSQDMGKYDRIRVLVEASAPTRPEGN